MMQPTAPPPGPPKRNLSETVWTKLDRKATAIAEFTIRQYRKKRSTWTVGAVGAILVVVVLLFYIDAMSEGIESVDDDGDGLLDGWEVANGLDPLDDGDADFGEIESNQNPNEDVQNMCTRY